MQVVDELNLCLDKMLDYFVNYLDHPYKNVREAVASLLFTMFSIAKQVPRDGDVPTRQGDPPLYLKYALSEYISKFPETC